MQTARATFAKPRPRPDPAAAQPRLPLGPLANPYVAAGAAAGFFALCAVALIALTGDPKAGAPMAHVSLATIAQTSAPPGWSEARPSESPGEAPFDSATVELSPLGAGAPSDGGAPGGQAIITISGDTRVEGAQAADSPLTQAPIAGFFAQGAAGPLPVIAADGRTPAQAYARPFTVAPGKPEVALIIGGLGLNAKATREAIDSLPPEVTLSFVPYADGLQGWIDAARAAGHEVLIEAPMEPKDYPDNDPGPYTLMSGGDPAETTRRLEWLLSRATGYFGVTNYLGSKFVQSPSAMGVFADSLRQRGVAFVDDGTASSFGGGIERASANRIIDDQLDGPTIEVQLATLESEASRDGKALGSGFAYPITLQEAAKWTGGLAQRGYQLVPASALLARR